MRNAQRIRRLEDKAGDNPAVGAGYITASTTGDVPEALAEYASSFGTANGTSFSGA